MTVCIGAIQSDGKHPMILTVVDRKLTLYGGWFSHEGTVKFRAVHAEWVVYVAGDMSEAQPLQDAVERSLSKLKQNVIERVVAACRTAYMRERRRMIERQILTDYDVYNFKEYVTLRTKEPELYKRINDVIKEEELNWNLLVAGFDKASQPHLFTITERGKITYCDSQNFAVIGSGALAATMYLASFPYLKRLEIGLAAFAVAAAKFFSETASGVGESTIMTVMQPKQKRVLVLGDEDMKPFRKGWIGLAKIPEGMEKQFYRLIVGHLRLYDALPSDYQTLEPER